MMAVSKTSSSSSSGSGRSSSSGSSTVVVVVVEVVVVATVLHFRSSTVISAQIQSHATWNFRKRNEIRLQTNYFSLIKMVQAFF